MNKIPKPKHEDRSKVCQSPYREEIEELLREKNNRDLSYQDIALMCKERFDLELSRVSVYRHHKWMKEKESLAMTE